MGLKLEDFPMLSLESVGDRIKEWSEGCNSAGFEHTEGGPGTKEAGNGFSSRSSRKEYSPANILMLAYWDMHQTSNV